MNLTPFDNDYDLESSYQDGAKVKVGPNSIRRNFIKKVYTILALQLLTTCIFVGLSLGPLNDFFLSASQHPVSQGPWIFFAISVVAVLISLIILTCDTESARKVPTNYILLLVFTLADSYLVAFTTAFAPPKLVLIAAGCTLVITIILTMIAWFTDYDFTKWGVILAIALCCLVMTGILMMFVNPSKTMFNIITGFSIFLFAIYLIYDTQLIIGEKRYKIGMDEYIHAALMLYIDIISMFLDILTLLKDN